MDQNRGRASVQAYLRERANRPFGDVESVSGRTLEPFSVAGQEAAENLLAKAWRALDNDDPERAAAYDDRATRLPFDEREKVVPVAWAVHMELFNAVTDAMEQADANDSRWLDAALDVLSRADERAACDLRDVLVAIGNDYLDRGAEQRRIRAAIASVPDRPPLSELNLTPSELRGHVLAVLGACRDYEAVLASLGG